MSRPRINAHSLGVSIRTLVHGLHVVFGLQAVVPERVAPKPYSKRAAPLEETHQNQGTWLGHLHAIN